MYYKALLSSSAAPLFLPGFSVPPYMPSSNSHAHLQLCVFLEHSFSFYCLLFFSLILFILKVNIHPGYSTVLWPLPLSDALPRSAQNPLPFFTQHSHTRLVLLCYLPSFRPYLQASPMCGFAQQWLIYSEYLTAKYLNKIFNNMCILYFFWKLQSTWHFSINAKQLNTEEGSTHAHMSREVYKPGRKKP